MVKLQIALPLLAGWIFQIILMLSEAGFARFQIEYFNESPHNVSILMYVLFGGRISGSFLFCFLSEIIGQKYTLLGITLPYIISCGLFQFFKGYALRYIATVLLGIASGGIHTVLSIYISEIAEKSSRGKLVSMLSVVFCVPYVVTGNIMPKIRIDIFFSLLNYGGIVLSLFVAFIFGLRASESPLYYLRKRKEGSANEILKKLRDVDDAQMELNELNCSHFIYQTNQYRTNDKIMSCLKSNGVVKAFLMMLSLVILHSFCGIQTAQIYTDGLLHRASLNNITTWITGLMMALSALACSFTVDRIGRKKCLMISFGGMGICSTYLCIINGLVDRGIINFHNLAYYAVPFVILFNASYSFGVGPIPYVLVGEIFPLKIKMIISALLTASLGVLLNLSFTIDIFIYSFTISLFISSVVCVLGIIAVHFLFLETAGKSLLEIQIDLRRY